MQAAGEGRSRECAALTNRDARTARTSPTVSDCVARKWMASTTKSRGTMLISEVPSPTMAMGTVRLNLRQYDHCEYGPSYFCVSPVRLWRAQVYHCVSRSRSS